MIGFSQSDWKKTLKFAVENVIQFLTPQFSRGYVPPLPCNSVAADLIKLNRASRAGFEIQG